SAEVHRCCTGSGRFSPLFACKSRNRGSARSHCKLGTRSLVYPSMPQHVTIIDASPDKADTCEPLASGMVVSLSQVVFPCARERIFFLRANADKRCRCARNARECRDGVPTLQRRPVCKKNRTLCKLGFDVSA